MVIAGCARTQSVQEKDGAANEPTSESEWGSIDVEEVKSSLQAYGSGSQCVLDAKEAGEQRWGHVVVSFEISEDGELSRVVFSENTAGETAARCIEQMLQKVQFPEPTGGPVLLRKFYAYSPDGEFDTERDASAFVSDDDGAIVLSPVWTVPVTTKGMKEVTTKSMGSDTQPSNRRPRLEMSSPVEISGPGELSTSAVGPIMRISAGPIRGCYVDFLGTHDQEEGKVTVTFKLHEDGSMSELRATSNSVGGEMWECVTKEVGKISFNPPEGGHVVVTKTFGFKLE
jgi:hypothetical protein